MWDAVSCLINFKPVNGLHATKVLHNPKLFSLSYNSGGGANVSRPNQKYLLRIVMTSDKIYFQNIIKWEKIGGKIAILFYKLSQIGVRLVWNDQIAL